MPSFKEIEVTLRPMAVSILYRPIDICVFSFFCKNTFLNSLYAFTRDLLFMYSRSILYRTSFPLVTHVFSNSKEIKLTINPIIVIGIAIRYKLIPVDFMADSSFLLARRPMLKTVDMSIAIGSPIFINQGIAYI